MSLMKVLMAVYPQHTTFFGQPVVTMSKLRNPRDNLSWPGEDCEAAKHKEPGAEHPCGQEQEL